MNPSRRYVQHAAPIVIVLVAILSGWVVSRPASGETAPTVALGSADLQAQSLEGTVRTISEKAKSITLDVYGNIELLKFNDETSGLKHAKKGKEIVVRYISQGDIRMALSITPDLVPLPEGVAEISPADLAALITPGKKDGYLLVDPRPERLYAEGHIASAVSIPLTTLKTKGGKLLPADRQVMIIFYCDGIKCSLAPKSAAIAKGLGYTNLHVLRDGIPAWDKAGLPLIAGNGILKAGESVLLDLRSRPEATAGHIPGAVNIPLAEFKEMEWELPSSHWTPIVLYGNGTEAESAFAMLRSWGYKTTVSLVDGGLAGWIAAGGVLEKGPAAAKITWGIRLAEGEVPVEEFKQVLAGKRTDVLILDVRNVAETEDGMFPGAVNIPLEEVGNRLGELPRDKEIFVHCATGIRAEMAMLTLKKAGFKVRFLIGNINCAEQKCRID